MKPHRQDVVLAYFTLAFALVCGLFLIWLLSVYLL